jgi:uncharacterized protein (DUF4415 family)
MSKLSAKERQRLKALAARSDDEIDLSDIPEVRQLPPDFAIGNFFRPVKQSVTIRLDADVLAWLKSQGEGYQTRINEHLRELMNQKRKRR